MSNTAESQNTPKTEAERLEAQKQLILQQVASSSALIRDAIAASLPCAKDQYLAVQIPGLVVSPEQYLWDESKSREKTNYVKCKEAALVDGMVPPSKITLGRSGKSVARSYSAALDLLVPVEASVAGTLAQPNTKDSKNLPPEKQLMKNRYEEAMRSLTKVEKGGKTRIEWYVEKQETWSRAVAEYEQAKDKAREEIRLDHKELEDQENKYMDWLQVHARDYKAKTQAKYMDWVVHGYKFDVEFNFGVVDISSGMKRVESSKEAFRNLGIIDPNGSTEWQEVRLTPDRWASYAKWKLLDYDELHKKPTRSEILFEIKRLQSLKSSHEGLKQAVTSGTFYPTLLSAGSPALDSSLTDAYKNLYERQNFRSKLLKLTAAEGGAAFEDPEAGKLSKPSPKDAQETEDQIVGAKKTLHDMAYTSATKGLADSRKNVLETRESEKTKLGDDLQRRITDIDTEIASLKTMLGSNDTNGPPQHELSVVDENGMPVDSVDLKARPEFKPGKQDTSTMSQQDIDRKIAADAWTRICVKVEVAQQSSQKVAEDSASHVAAAVSGWFRSAEVSVSHASSSSAATEAISKCAINISFDALLVEIDRPWLHGELFSDQELDIGQGFTLSPGPDELKEQIVSGKSIDPKYSMFPSYPTAFVLASNVELEFMGSTSSLESHIHASKTEANASVGYGPFSLSASHKQSKSGASTKMESTSTGLKISLRAPQIIGWVSTVLPALPRPEAKLNATGALIQEVVKATDGVKTTDPKLNK